MSAQKNFCRYPMIFFQDELMQNWELAKDMKLGLYVSGFWHIHAKTPRGTVVCEQ